MANSYSINRCTWKWKRKLFFNLFEVPIRNKYIFLLARCKKILHSDFQNILQRKLLAHAGHERNVQRLIGRSPAAATQIVRFEERGSEHWPIPSATRRRFRVCAEKCVTRNVSVICERCDVALCCDTRCFVDYHNKADA